MSLQMESKDYIKNIDGAERRYFASEVRAVVVDGEAVRAVDGYAAKFNSTYYWVYYPLSKRSGAFDDCLNDDVRYFLITIQTIFWHVQKRVGTLKLEVDATGLKYSYDSPKRSYANDLLMQ
jgi:phage head maturation protease